MVEMELDHERCYRIVSSADARFDGWFVTAVRYRSTRSTESAADVSFEQALLEGLAPDGGLYLPSTLPALPPAWREAESLAELAVQVLPPLVGAGPGELDDLLRDALDFEVPLVPLSDDRYVLELFHGPTLAFKDVGARVMARLMARARARKGGALTILAATSGDTGSAVADAFAGLDGVRVVLLYPMGRVSDVQERQLTVVRPGVTTFAVRGDFDDCQRLAKEAFADPDLRELGLSSANSINIGRLLPQALYYLWGALLWQRAGAEPGVPLLFCVPSGNLGNLTAGVLANRMGLDVARFLAAHNANDYFPGFLRGDRAAYAFKPTIGTLSNAMDVGSPSNFERLETLLQERLPERVWGVSVDDDATLASMRQSVQRDGYLPCPHTAVGLAAVERYRAETGTSAATMVLATAHPAKFPDAVVRATGQAAPHSPALDALLGLEQRVLALEPDLAALREALVADATISP